MSNQTPQQVPLGLNLDASATFANYWSANNGRLIEHLKQFISSDEGDEGGWVYIAGESGSGVSHLLQASSAFAKEQEISVIYVSLREMLAAYGDQSPVGIFDSMEKFDLLCLDDIELVAEKPVWQEQLFYLLEKIKNRTQSRLLIGGKRAATQLNLELADLQSRLAWATGFYLPALTDEDKLKFLQFKALQLGLSMTDEVAIFLLNRCSRLVGDLVSTLAELDKQAMISQRRLTIPWIKTVLAI